MPVPNPRTGQTQQQFMSYCISTMHDRDPNRPHDQIVAMCGESWRGTHGKGIDILSRLANLKDKLVLVFGELGERWFNYTLDRLGVSKNADGTLNLGVFKDSDMPVPFAKGDGDCIEFCNMTLFERPFMKLDEGWSVVAAYANVPVVDCDLDLIMPDAYRSSAEAYMKHPAKVYFYHHGMEAGDLLSKFKDKDGHLWKSAVTDVGWFVVSRPHEEFRMMIDNGKLRGYSIAGRFTMKRNRMGNVTVWDMDSVEVGDVSYVPSSCCKLSFFDLGHYLKSGEIPEKETKRQWESNERLSLEERLEWSLIKDRTIIFHGEVYERSCQKATRRLEYLGKSKEPIYIILNSVGGGVYDGLLVFDTIKRLTEKGIPVVTEARGLAASMGSIILQAGTKRLATPHTRFLIHEVSTMQWGETSKLEERTEELRKLNDMLNQIYAERTGKSVEEINKLVAKTDYWLSAEEAFDFGLIDEIIQHGSPSFDFMKQFDRRRAIL